MFQIPKYEKMSYQINLRTNIQINVENCNFREITFLFLYALKDLFQEYVSEILVYYFEENYKNKRLSKLLGVQIIKKKTRNKTTKFKTLFGDILVPQIQVRVVDFKGKQRQMSITRTLLGVSPMFQIPDFMKEIIAWIGSVSTFRVGHNIIGILSNFKCSLMSVWNSVQWRASRIKLELSLEGTNETQADGTGIPTVKTGKRGSELKKIFQIKKDGTLHLIGMTIGKYKNANDWDSIIREQLLAIINKFGKVFVVSDGDKSIIETALSLGEKVKIQFDIWHIFHQMKYYLWADGLAKDYRSKIISHFYKKTMLLKCSITKRDYFIKRYIYLLESSGFSKTASYLKTSMTYFYTHEKEGNSTLYTTKTERSMRTTNQRINVGVWSDDGALSVAKIRDAYYYNGISPLNWKNTA